MNREKTRHRKPMDKREILFRRCGGICPVCGKVMQNKYPNARDTYMTIDHIVPKSKSGTNNIDNLRPMCRQCNMSRGNKDSGRNNYIGSDNLWHSI